MKDNNIMLSTYRYDFSESIAETLAEFALIHRYDERIVFKESWSKWIQDDELSMRIKEETNRLKTAGYEGDVLDKMFKSARYYYRKKKPENKQQQKEQKNQEQSSEKNIKYSGFGSEFLELINANILQQINDTTNILSTPSIPPAPSGSVEFTRSPRPLLRSGSGSLQSVSIISPAEAYVNFYKTYRKEILAELIALKNRSNDLLDSEKISIKLKKTYKNRYYNIRSNSQIVGNNTENDL